MSEKRAPEEAYCCDDTPVEAPSFIHAHITGVGIEEEEEAESHDSAMPDPSTTMLLPVMVGVCGVTATPVTYASKLLLTV